MILPTANEAFSTYVLALPTATAPTGTEAVIMIQGGGAVQGTTAKILPNTVALANSIVIGNTSVNATMNSSSFVVNNATGSFTVGITAIAYGNTIANSAANSTVIKVTNSVSQTVITPLTTSTGNTIANSFVNSTAHVVINATANTVVSPGTVTIAGTGSNQGLVLGTHAFGAAATNGYSFLPNGLLLQWNTLASVNTAIANVFTFKVAFPTACFAVMVSSNTGGVNATGGTLKVYGTNTTTCTVYSGNITPMTVSTLAVGN